MSTNALAALNPGRPVQPTDQRGWDFALRILATIVLVGGYYWYRAPLSNVVNDMLSRGLRQSLDPAVSRVVVVLTLLGLLLIVWRKLVGNDPRFQAPLLVTTILAVGDAAYSILESHPAPPWLVLATHGLIKEYSPTFLAIAAAILIEMILGRFFWGKWPHLASAYVSGISVGILVKSSALWPFILCALISITSKYALRIGDRHLWNPTNFGMTMMLLLAPAHMASLSTQAGNNGLAVVTIWVLGGMIMYRLGRFHIPAAFVVSFALLSILRSYVTGHPWQTEMAPLTSPMFQLYICFMITDPKTTTRGWKKQTAVAVMVAVMETFLRLAFKDVHSLYHALFIVGPVTNLAEIYADAQRCKASQKKCDAAPLPHTNNALLSVRASELVPVHDLK